MKIEELENVVRDRLLLLLKRRLRRKVKDFLSRKPRNCSNVGCSNMEWNETSSFCRLRTSLVCTQEVARVCPYFVCRNVIGDVKKKFSEIINDDKKCSVYFPKIHTLKWILGIIDNGKLDT